MFTREGVTEEKWYKDQVRLYGLLNELSKTALEELEFIADTNGSQDIRLSAKEIKKRESMVRQVRAIFKKLDPVHTQVS
tara:strand:+ start:432 stop:668 length:237 start_codon:yes stop_codon:yes gene_type:complete